MAAATGPQVLASLPLAMQRKAPELEGDWLCSVQNDPAQAAAAAGSSFMSGRGSGRLDVASVPVIMTATHSVLLYYASLNSSGLTAANKPQTTCNF